MKSVFTLSIDCVWGAHLKTTFHRVVEVASDTTLGDLQCFIQKLTGFDDDHLSVFYVANTYHGHKTYLMDNEESDTDDARWEKTLAQLYPLGPHKKLYYWFDFGDDWKFEIRKLGKEKAANPRVKYPRVVAKEGPKPVQYPSFDE